MGRELSVRLRPIADHQQPMVITFRVFDDGFGFKYKLPLKGHNHINEELTEFNFLSDSETWWIPSNYDSYEKLYTKSSLSKLDSVNTPLTMKVQNDLYLSIHEADLKEYTGVTLKRKEGTITLTTALVPWPDGIKVKKEGDIVSPLRTIIVGDSPGALLESNLPLNLSEESKVEDVGWIKPIKYVGIWWSLHIGTETWTEGPRHGATTANAKRYIDFAAENEITGVLVEGYHPGNGNITYDYTDTYADFDLPEVAHYAHEKVLNSWVTTKHTVSSLIMKHNWQTRLICFNLLTFIM